MKFWNFLKKYEKLRFFVGLLAVGIIFTVIGAIIISLPKKELLPAEATITAIDSHPSMTSDGGTDYTVYVKYTDADGVLHENVEYGGYSSSMKVNDIITVRYDPEFPEIVSSDGGEYIPYVITAVGIICVIVSVIKIVNTAKTKADDMNQLDKVDKQNVSPELIEKIKNSDEETKEYYFHWCGKLNQSYVLETHDRTEVYKADCDKISLFTPYIYTFSDCRTGDSFTCNITHTKTTSYGSENFSSVTDSSFKIDDENIWDYLAKDGYSLEPHINGIKMNFDVMRYGIKVAYLEAAGVNILKDDKTSKLGEVLPGNGLYKVSCKDADLKNVFMAAFTLSRIDLF